ncbi:MAG TPA: type II 3-dehydroquinate dehydratase [Polyangiaceae bacterium]|nr:type II 3-dehydroquinate dehydratase [Polyangiaceae bacterium]
MPRRAAPGTRARVKRAARKAGNGGNVSAPPERVPRVLVLSGPNLDRLGRREPDIYGRTTLAEIHRDLEELAASRGATVECRQSNHEGTLIDWIGEASDQGFHAILINPGAFTHTSYALHDAIKGSSLPTVELHLSNPDAREAFRRHSCVAPACLGRIAGFGPRSYRLALDGVLEHLRTRG